MKTYEPGIADVSLFTWWKTMALTGDLQRGYTGLDTLSSFFASMQAPTQLIYEENEAGIWFAMWAEPRFGGAFVHVWIATEARQTKKAVRAVIEALNFYLGQFPGLIGVTGSETVALEHEKFGFVRLCEIPLIFGDEDTYITLLTREKFTQAIQQYEPLMHEEAVH